MQHCSMKLNNSYIDSFNWNLVCAYYVLQDSVQALNFPLTFRLKRSWMDLRCLYFYKYLVWIHNQTVFFLCDRFKQFLLNLNDFTWVYHKNCVAGNLQWETTANTLWWCLLVCVADWQKTVVTLLRKTDGQDGISGEHGRTSLIPLLEWKLHPL